ncbi:MAG TPA: RpiB/LacA/LacB family sugar-phosphate isomerase [Opitutaceae bacterium]|jgi:ribose 5-phosphate isomerase B
MTLPRSPRRSAVRADAGPGARNRPQSVGLAADHRGFALKAEVEARLRAAGWAIEDFGDHSMKPQDDYPDFVVPLARAVAKGRVWRGIAICGSGVGANIAANKVGGARACLITDLFSARQGVEDDNMNILCLGALVTREAAAWDFIQAFLGARFSGAARHRRRLAKVEALEGASR